MPEEANNQEKDEPLAKEEVIHLAKIFDLFVSADIESGSREG